MISSFSTALSGLNAMSTAIDIVGNNLANLNTTGYKDDTASFKDLVAQSLSGNGTSQVGLGTSAPLTDRVFSQGTITATQGALNAAINGNGFFVVKNPSGQDFYTRDGSFQVDQNGFLTTSTGESVQGWSTQNLVLNTGGPLGDIQVPVGQSLPPRATTAFSLAGNLDSSAQSGAANGTFVQQIQAVDSLGNQTPLTVTFAKDPVVAGQWNYAVTGPAGTAVTNGTGSVQFNNQTGIMTSPTTANGNIPLTVSGMSDGAASMNINWNLYNPDNSAKFTGYSEASSVSANTQNGQPAAQLTGVSLANDGKLVATYSNGAQQQVVAQVALAGIRNPESLVDVGNNNFTLSADTAAPAIGTSGTGGRGVIDGKSLEGSTVDIATEFANLLVYQRSYQANSRVVTVSDSLAQEAVNLVHA
ncbi:MAG: flagellar hook protein FlgE [Acidobacteriota bacterium]|nr:flagellar hook protein FlgE [Acidobacteriota bacterium]